MRNISRHITIVGWLHIALNLITIGFAIFFRLKYDATFLPSAMVIFSIPGLLAGVGLIKHRPWARILGIVMSVFNLLTFLHGTVIGIYSLMVLFDPEAVRLLGRDAARPMHE